MAVRKSAAKVTPRVRKIRRIVTGHDAKGRSVFASDRASPHVIAIAGTPTFGVTDLWRTSRAPADNASKKDPCVGIQQLAPQANGSVVRVVEFPPDKVWMAKVTAEKAFASLGKSGSAALAANKASSRHTMMHTTDTVDYAIILAGEIWAVMDVGEKKMTAGDVLIQRGTNHAWSNRSSKPCLVAFVLIDAKPVRGAKRSH